MTADNNLRRLFFGLDLAAAAKDVYVAAQSAIDKISK